jgi:N-formylglutamate amidohydrolase
LVATAIHSGHDLRRDIEDRLALDSDQRRREEDPFTDAWTAIVPNRIVVHRSRFEVDLNRARDLAVYRNPEQAWGLELWKRPPDEALIAESLVIYDSFYSALGMLLQELQERYGGFVLLDLHSYNFRRTGPQAPPEEPSATPEINIGTKSMPRERWSRLTDGFMEELRRCRYAGRPLDVRENVRFMGGNLPRWVHRNFPNGCAIAVEVKKIFMDEWTGEPLPGGVEAIGNALAATIPVLRNHLEAG